LRSVLSLLLDAVSLLLVIRAILSWIFPVPENNVLFFIYTLADKIVEPVKRFLSRFRFVRECPIDLSFLAAFVLISFLRSVI